MVVRRVDVATPAWTNPVAGRRFGWKGLSGFTGSPVRRKAALLDLVECLNRFLDLQRRRQVALLAGIGNPDKVENDGSADPVLLRYMHGAGPDVRQPVPNGQVDVERLFPVCRVRHAGSGNLSEG
jgi:hypothetical protein